MKQTVELGTGVVTQMVVGAITGIAFVRRLFFLTILLVAVTVAMGSFMFWMMLNEYFPGQPTPAVQGAPEDTKKQQPKPPPDKRDDAEELQKLIRANPL